MYDNQLYASGVFGVFVADWQLKCETPLAIRNGVKIAFQVRDQIKSRGQGTRFYWRERDKSNRQDNEVTALHYGYEVLNDKVNAVHFVPASSVRGALRSWTINHLIHPDFRKSMTPPSREKPGATEVYLASVQEALNTDESGYQWIASLFGMAFDTRGEGKDLSNAGRLKIETKPFSNGQPQDIAVNGVPGGDSAGPTNVKRQMTVRNPLDRVTHASKEGGLHHFLEFSKGEVFNVRLTVRNPQNSDLGIISLWRRELESGMLRLGALSSIGRGRVSIHKEDYQIWLYPGAAKLMGFENRQPDEDSNEILSGLWMCYTISTGEMESFEHYLI